MCVVLAKELTQQFDVIKDERTTKVDFRVLLLQHCRVCFFFKKTKTKKTKRKPFFFFLSSYLLFFLKDNFERCFHEEDQAADQTADEKAEKEFRGRARLGANIAFIGELFLRNLLRPAILHMVIRALFAEDRQGTEKN